MHTEKNLKTELLRLIDAENANVQQVKKHHQWNMDENNRMGVCKPGIPNDISTVFQHTPDSYTYI